MNQGKLEVVKQEMARVNIDILEISELKWTGISPVQFSLSVVSDSLRSCGLQHIRLLVLHYLPEFAQIQVH